MTSWIVVSDFDGTLTTEDVGNELCKHFIPEKYEELRLLYRAKKINLRNYQVQMWTQFPCSEKEFRAFTRERAQLRPGVVEFLKTCSAKKIPVYIASCGLRPYIEETLSTLLPSYKEYIREIRCNEASFENSSLKHFQLATADTTSNYSLDKGAWCESLKLNSPGLKVLGIGNGSSDQSFIGHTEKLAATESLAQHCVINKTPFVPFTDFRDLMNFDVLFS